MNKTSASVEQSGASPRILVIRSGAIGDTLMATPLLRSLRTSFPSAYIAFLASGKAVDVLRFNPHVNEVFSLQRRHLPFFISLEKRRLAGKLRDRGIDVVISLEAHREFTDFACRLGPKQLVTYGPAVCPQAVRLAAEADNHSAESFLRAGFAIGSSPAGLATELYYPPESGEAVRARLAEDGIGEDDTLIGIHAGWGGRRQDPVDTRLRSWPADRFAGLIRRTAASINAKFVLTGSELDRELNDVIAAASGVPVVNAAGRYTLLESAALFHRMALCVTIDSGPAHIAAAVGTPLITLWGPGIYTATRPLAGLSPVTILREPPPCAPCYGTDRMNACRNNICMKNIGVAAVAVEVERVLAGLRA